MARRNGIWYEGRVITKNTKQSGLFRAKSGKMVLKLVIAEQFQERNDRCEPEFQRPELAADAYVNTHTAWHKVTVFDDDNNEEFVALVTNPLFAHGAIVSIDTSYREEKPWEDKSGKVHAGRAESIFFKGEDGGSIAIKVLDDGRVLGARDENAVAFWDGVSDLPPMAGSGGGGAPAAPEYSEEEGF